ncbi:MAG: ADP-ribosylglycohydrolase family protein, partial [Acidimicrobiaceae bacterium]|nr:ADP-ribosylglycohydrolase family protein [Acidimicrobiaceae bacterium]
REALVRFERTGEPYSGPTGPMSAGNGSLMRLAPVPMFFAGDVREAIDRSADSSRTTHGAVEAVDACRYFAGLLVGALRGVDKEMLLSDHYSPVEGLWDEAPLAPKVAAIAAGSFKHKQPPEIRGTGYVVDTLEAVLSAFSHTEDFREGAQKVVNLGDDADTTGAIFGQVAGAHYGVESIPAEWRQRLTMGTEITSMADRLRERAVRSI